ncbi:MAG: glucose-phosphate cytidylyltransferase [Nitrospirae bacterium]|nr:glucose-phosphate cytidylyltransferase [Nitrospirota bacterium]
MKAVILAGGYGTRLSEETSVRPKPMVEIGAKPILWHIMKIFSAYGIHEFIICCGYKGHMIKQYFSQYFLEVSDITFDMKENKMNVHTNGSDPWKVTLVDTGEKTMTGGRLKRVKDYIDNETFCFTYGDGLSDVDIKALIEFHKKQKTHATLTAVQPPGRFGILSLEKDKVVNFREKPHGDGAWINGGYFVLEPAVLDYIDNDASVWEQEPLMRLAQDSMLSAYRHEGFWHPMDTLRDKHVLEEMWENGKAPWKKW